MLYQKISKKDKEKKALNMEFSVSRMLVMAKVLFGLHLVNIVLSPFIDHQNHPRNKLQIAPFDIM